MLCFFISINGTNFVYDASSVKFYICILCFKILIHLFITFTSSYLCFYSWSLRWFNDFNSSGFDLGFMLILIILLLIWVMGFKLISWFLWFWSSLGAPNLWMIFRLLYIFSIRTYRPPASHCWVTIITHSMFNYICN